MHRYGEMCYFDLYFNRLRKIIKVADEYEVDTLLIGAWGRGVFRNDPAVIKQAINEAMKGARTVRLEAKSVEDNGKGIDFDVLIFNEQKGITINYANGKSKGKGQKSTTAKKSTTKPTLKQVWITATGKKYHRISKCGNRKCSKKLSLTEAKRLHLTSCKKCYK